MTPSVGEAAVTWVRLLCDGSARHTQALYSFLLLFSTSIKIILKIIFKRGGGVDNQELGSFLAQISIVLKLMAFVQVQTLSQNVLHMPFFWIWLFGFYTLRQLKG